jgi:1-acyl-sn-glycerol-3-phosphate acyltransferase
MEGLRLHGLASLWWLKVICATRYEVRGHEKLPKGACLVASKHQSAWDSFALIPVFRDPAMVMKVELGWIPLYGWFSTVQHASKRDRPQRAEGSSARRCAGQGREIVISPRARVGRRALHPTTSPVSWRSRGLALPCVPVALSRACSGAPRHPRPPAPS